jgi:hypothetical protein
MPRITISYRRDDSLDITGRIFDRLAAHFGREAVFRDIDNIPLGVDFRRHIDGVLGESDIILAIIGPRWIGMRAGQSRLTNPADPVRLEIETALQKGKPLIPVLVSRATMPRAEQLPETLHDFVFRHALQVDAGQDFDTHIARLIRGMDQILESAVHREAPVDREAPVAAENDVATAPSAPEPEPQPVAELEALRAANRELEMQLAAAAAARDDALSRIDQVRAEVVAVSLRGEEETNDLTEQLSAARNAAGTSGQEIRQLEEQLEEQRQALLRSEERRNELETQVAAALLRGEQELKSLTEQLAAARDAAGKATGRTNELQAKADQLATALSRSEDQRKRLESQLVGAISALEKAQVRNAATQKPKEKVEGDAPDLANTSTIKDRPAPSNGRIMLVIFIIIFGVSALLVLAHLLE